MVPWQVAGGLTLVAVGLAALWAMHALADLAPSAPAILRLHGPRLAAEAAAAVLTLFAGLYRLAVAAGLAAMGTRMAAADARARDPRATHDPDLAAALERDRRGSWEP